MMSYGLRSADLEVPCLALVRPNVVVLGGIQRGTGQGRSLEQGIEVVTGAQRKPCGG